MVFFFFFLSLFLSLFRSLSLSLSSLQQENRYPYFPEKDPGRCFNLIQVLIVPIHFCAGALSSWPILRASENIKFTQKTRGDVGVKFRILTNALGEWAVHFNKGSGATNLRSYIPGLQAVGKFLPPLPSFASRQNVLPLLSRGEEMAFAPPDFSSAPVNDKVFFSWFHWKPNISVAFKTSLRF